MPLTIVEPQVSLTVNVTLDQRLLCDMALILPSISTTTLCRFTFAVNLPSCGREYAQKRPRSLVFLLEVCSCWSYMSVYTWLVHGLPARGVHYFHRPGPLLQDVGFFLLRELGIERA